MAFSDHTAEESVLSSFVHRDSYLREQSLRELLPRIEGKLFTDERFRLIFETIAFLRTHSKPVSLRSVQQCLADSGKLNKAGGETFVATLCCEESDMLSASYDLNRLQQLECAREINGVGNDLVKESAAGIDTEAIIEKAFQKISNLRERATHRQIKAIPLAALEDTIEAGAELIRDRFLCRGAGAMLIGASGIGKSTLAQQLAMAWALGREAFGLHPSGKLKSLIVQAENDGGDLMEMRDGAIRGMALTERDAAIAAMDVLIHTCDCYTREQFLKEVIEPLLRTYKPDVLWLDPLFAFFGADIKDNLRASEFLRAGLNPILHRHGCACIILHHSNKPSSGNQKPQWEAGDFAYLGAGATEFTNWPRAILAIQSIGSHDVFKMHAAKRGARLPWVDEAGAPTRARHIAHANDGSGQFWRDADPEECEANKGGAPEKLGAGPLLKIMGNEEWSSAGLLHATGEKVSAKTIGRKLKELQKEGLVEQTEIGRKWKVKQ